MKYENYSNFTISGEEMLPSASDFSKIESHRELIAYLTNANARLSRTTVLCQYTRLDAVVNIISDRSWYLGSPRNMNDGLELQQGLEGRDDIFFSSFMAEQRESIAMWSMYAQPWEDGIMISIPVKTFKQWMKEIKKVYRADTRTKKADREEYDFSVDFDHAVAAYLTDKVGNRVSCEKEALFRQMLQYSEHIKCQMSSQETVHLSFEIDSDNGDICMMPFFVTRKEFESVTKGLTKKFKSKLERLKKAYEEISELYENEPLVIYLTGQVTKLSILKELIYKVFPGVPVNSDYQESALIQGLSEQSRCLWANRKMDKNVDGLLLNLSYISLVLKCQRYDEEEHAAILSRAGNHNDLVFLEQETVPCKSSVKLMFTDLTGLEERKNYYELPEKWLLAHVLRAP